jgi:hypothetical protein
MYFLFNNELSFGITRMDAILFVFIDREVDLVL